jgi:hypothetical protein
LVVPTKQASKEKSLTQQRLVTPEIQPPPGEAVSIFLFFSPQEDEVSLLHPSTLGHTGQSFFRENQEEACSLFEFFTSPQKIL